MTKQATSYRKNFSLIIIFLVLISVTFIIALIVSYYLNVKYVENEFASKKVEVQEQTIKPYGNFFQNSLPQITSYQGFMDSTAAARYADSTLRNYDFVKRVVFYDVLVGNQKDGFIVKNNLGISIKAMYQF